MSKRIGRYHVIRVLGAGAMGEVLLAEDRDLDRRVALKVIHPDVAHSERARSRFRREARALAALNVPNVVTIHEIGVDGDREFIAMEFVEGRPLHQAVAEGMPLQALLGIAADVAQALSDAHAAGVLHRDVKPENLMVSSDGDVKLLDFGIARLERDGDATASDGKAGPLDPWQTQEGTLVGTPAYMAPEALAGRAASGSDTFSLGVTLFELVSGEHPFEADVLKETLRRIVEAREPPRLPPPAPPELTTLVAEMMANDPARRPPLPEVVARLRNMTASGAAGARAQPDRDPYAATVDMVAPSPARRSWRAPVVGLGVFVLAAAGLGFLAGESSRAPDAKTSVPTPGPIALAVPPFEAHIEGLSEDRSEGMAYLSSTLLRAVPDLVVVSPQDLRGVLAFPVAAEPDWEAAARELSATHIVLASVSSEGERLRGEARVMSLGDESLVGVVNARADALDPLLSELASEVARLLLPDAVVPPLRGHSLGGLEDYELGSRALGRQEWSGALTHLERAVTANPEFFQAWYQLALARLWAPAPTEETESAARHAHELARSPRDRAVTTGLLAYLRNDEAEAIRILQPMHEEHPRDRDVAYTLGEALYHSGRRADGVEVFERLLVDSPEFRIAAMHPVGHAIVARDDARARLYERMLRAEDAEPTRYLSELDFAMGRYDAAASDGAPVDVRVAALTMLGRDDEAHALLERTHAEDAPEVLLDQVARAVVAGNTAAALAGTRRIVEATPESTSPVRWFTVRHLAQVLVAGRELDSLRLVAALSSTSDNETTRFQIGLHAAAIDPALELPSMDDARAYYRRAAEAVQLERDGDHAGAIAIWRETIEDPSEHYELLERIALHRNLVAAGQRDEADAFCADLRAPPIWRPMVRVMRARCAAE